MARNSFQYHNSYPSSDLDLAHQRELQNKNEGSLSSQGEVNTFQHSKSKKSKIILIVAAIVVVVPSLTIAGICIAEDVSYRNAVTNTTSLVRSGCNFQGMTSFSLDTNMAIKLEGNEKSSFNVDHQALNKRLSSIVPLLSSDVYSDKSTAISSESDVKLPSSYSYCFKVAPQSSLSTDNINELSYSGYSLYLCDDNKAYLTYASSSGVYNFWSSASITIIAGCSFTLDGEDYESLSSFGVETLEAI